VSLQIELVSGAFFENGDAKEPRIHVRGLEGREEVSQLFEFRLLLSRSSAFSSAEIEQLLTETCAVRFADSHGNDADTYVHGILSRIDRIDSRGADTAYYYAELVPRVWPLSQNRCSRAFRGLSLFTIIANLTYDFGLTSHEIEWRLSVAAPESELEYVVQYEESDWSFVQRWLEREGLSYWFEHGEKGDVLVIADATRHSSTDPDPVAMNYRNASLSQQTSDHAHTIYDWSRCHRRTIRRVALVDYDVGFRTGEHATTAPSRWIRPSAAVPSNDGYGGQREFGALGSHVHLAHFTNTAEADGGAATGQQLATRWAQRKMCERVAYTASTQSRLLRAGTVFRLHGSNDPHGHGSYDAGEDDGQKYFVTALDHHYGAKVSADSAQLAANLGGADESYRITLTAVRADVHYRPPARTPWPRIDGVLIGQVMGHGDPGDDDQQKFPTIDQYGRYKVRLPFIMASEHPAYAWARMAESLSGQRYGVHLPLRPGSEVLLAHIGGDPDRPIIVGTVPHGKMQTPVAVEDAEKARLRSAGGVQMEIDENSV